MPVFDWRKEVPGYADAIDRETRGRDIAFLGLTEFICGIEVLPFSPYHFLRLSLVGCPFVCGGIPEPEDVSRFLWVVSPKFKDNALMLTRWRRNQFVAMKCRPLVSSDQIDNTIQAIGKYLEFALSDCDGDSSGSKRSSFSCAAGLVDRLASEYGWSEQTILRMPFNKLFQLLRSLQLRHDPECPLINPSDKIRLRWISERNSKSN